MNWPTTFWRRSLLLCRVSLCLILSLQRKIFFCRITQPHFLKCIMAYWDILGWVCQFCGMQKLACNFRVRSHPSMFGSGGWLAEILFGWQELNLLPGNQILQMTNGLSLLKATNTWDILRHRWTFRSMHELDTVFWIFFMLWALKYYLQPF